MKHCPASMKRVWLSMVLVAGSLILLAAVLTATAATTDHQRDTLKSKTGLGGAKSVYPVQVRSGEQLTYTVRITNSSAILVDTIWMTDDLPLEVTYSQNLTASSGSWGEDQGTITWTGNYPPAIGIGDVELNTQATLLLVEDQLCVDQPTAVGREGPPKPERRRGTHLSKS